MLSNSLVRDCALAHPIVIVGPTASGKTALSQEIAECFGGEVLSSDSMQIYRRMDIGTGKILPSEMRVAHYGLDLVEPGTPYSAALFQDFARSTYEELTRKNVRCVVCGGTGLYIRAFLDDYDFPKGEQEDNPIREKYTAYAAEHGNEALWSLLKEQDPKSAEVVHPNNVRRVVRAFELLEEGKTYAQQVENLHKIPEKIPACYIGLRVTPEVLNRRIDARVDKMVEDGLLEEVKRLLNEGFREGITAPQAIGYKELVAYLDGACSFEEAVESIKVASHRYAKRQRSWFKKDERVQWIDADDADIDRIAAEAIALVRAYDEACC